MTFEDLEEQGVILPEEEWGQHELQTTVRRVPLAIAFLGAVAGWVAALLGGGGPVTWAGVAAFLTMLLAVTWLCDRGVVRQRHRVEEVRRELGSVGGSSGSADGQAAESGGRRSSTP